MGTHHSQKYTYLDKSMTNNQYSFQVDEMMDTLDLDNDGNVNMDDFLRIFIDLNKEKSRKNSAISKCNIL